jgi:membrane protein DedA with SNARE-associated domain
MEAFIDDLLLRIETLPLYLTFLVFFASAFLQIAFPPYPGDTVLVFGGCLGGLLLSAHGTLAFLGYLSATVLTSLALYALGYRLNERIFRMRFIAKLMPVERRASVEHKYRRFGVGLLAVCKFIPGVNTLVILLGGVLRYPRVPACLAITLSSALHNLLFYYVGHLLGRNLDAIKLFLRDYTVVAISVVALLSLLGVGYLIFQSRKGKQK